MSIFSRTELLIGTENLNNLKNKKIALFGIGGVGSYVLEALVRCGIGRFVIVDSDKIDETNINRQLIALHSTIGKTKVEVAKNRALDINPHVEIELLCEFITAENIDKIDFSKLDYIVDAIDTVTSKLLLIEKAKEYNVPIISCMGTGGKMSPDLLQVADIKKTHTCPLAKVMRKELKDRGINSLKVVFSPEKAVKSDKVIPSISFVPASAGLLIASEIVKDLIS